jgi:hypothetical protein
LKTVTNRPCFQGDLMIRRIDAIPSGLKRAEPDGNRHVLAHSETGHHHVIEARGAERFIDEMNSFIAYLDVADETELRHLRDFDTHESLSLPPGKYEVRNAREYTPEGWRRSAD